ncbi:MAG: glycoside hydrolase family 2 [Oscillospiraceae bacterium]|nr:glycoside hydrolase family 2 [Oscillospiraceae bacterium]
MESRFTKDVNRECPLSEYPRPQLVRKQWECLNGPWDYAILPEGEQVREWKRSILVPFSPETELSGVGRILQPDEVLWYHRTFDHFPIRKGDRTYLHFGAVDQRAVVLVNGKEAGSHRGGYTSFTLDITDLLKIGENHLMVKVQDFLDLEEDSRGKQSGKPGGIWYTPQSGIWQTVWMETVPEDHISSLRIEPDYDSECCRVTVVSNSDDTVVINMEGVSFVGRANKTMELRPEEFHPWSPEDPHLYRFTVRLGEDEVESYFGIRKFSVEKDDKGTPRLFLNGSPYFHNGLLDQGYWPDGLYTAPTDEAMIYDIEAMKAMGFNCLRKHIKIEPDRWYYHCDRLGMLVWQDMPSGGGTYSPLVTFTSVALSRFSLKDDNYRLFARESEDGREEYYRELNDMIAQLYNFVSIAVWVPFNEGWGQFDAAKAVDFIQQRDTSRTIDHASGWHDQHVGEIQSLHIYFKPVRYREDKYGRAVCLTEFGGITLGLEAHTFEAKESGYFRSKDLNTVLEDFRKIQKTDHPRVEERTGGCDLHAGQRCGRGSERGPHL